MTPRGWMVLALLPAACGVGTDPEPMPPPPPVLAIQARLTGQVTVDGQVYPGLHVSDCLTEGGYGPNFAVVRAQVIEQAPTTGYSVGWDFHLGIADPASLELNVAGRMTDGLDVTVYPGQPEHGWGRMSIISPVIATGAIAALWVGDYRSEGGTGVLRVLRATPLEVDASIQFRDPGGRQAQVTGRITFTPFTNGPSCSN